MKTPNLLSLVVCILLLSISAAQSQFSYSYRDVYSPNAMDYIVGQNNIERTSEGGNPDSGVSYWNPINAGQEADLTFEFSFAQPTASISLNATIATFNFGGNEFGSGSLWGSTDGNNWGSLMTAQTPAYPGYPYGQSTIYDTNLPASLLGADQIFLQVRLDASAWNIMSQFSRQDTAASGGAGYFPTIFSIEVDTVPEPGTLVLSSFCGLVALVAYRRRE